MFCGAEAPDYYYRLSASDKCRGGGGHAIQTDGSLTDTNLSCSGGGGGSPAPAKQEEVYLQNPTDQRLL